MASSVGCVGICVRLWDCQGPDETTINCVQNAAARLVSGVRRRDHVTPLLRNLHWLPVGQRVIFITAVLVWKCIHGVVQFTCTSYALKWTASVVDTDCRLCQPRMHSATKSTNIRFTAEFAYNEPAVWNSLLAVSWRLMSPFSTNMAIKDKTSGVESYPCPVKEGQRYINLNPGCLFVQQPPKKGKGSRCSFKLLR